MSVAGLKQYETGFELTQLGRSWINSREMIHALVGGGVPPKNRDETHLFVRDFYRGMSGKRRFGGAISPGDAIFIAEFMRNVAPDEVIEFGVAAGVSSAFFLAYFEFAGLHASLASYDIGAHDEVGVFVRSNFPELLHRWTLHDSHTSLDFFNGGHETLKGSRRLFFVDAAHANPWPAIDAYAIAFTQPAGTWILLQDIALFERKLHDAIRMETQAVRSFRGAELVFEHWPGRKLRGIDACFNMGAVEVPEDMSVVRDAIRTVLAYPEEKPRIVSDDARQFLKDQGLVDN